MPLDHLTTMHMDKVVTKTGTKQPDWQWCPVRIINWDKKIPMQWTWTAHRSGGHQSSVISAKKLGHMMKDCCAPFNIQNMTYEELQDHFDQAEAAKKDREAICAKKKRNRIFPPQLSESTSTEIAELF